MMKALLPVVLVALLSPVLPSVPSIASSSLAEWTERGPIMIDSDLKFTSANGVVSGTGTKSDPYMIEGWKIGPSPNVSAIDVHYTTAHFRVRDVYVFSSSIGVLMNHVRNGRVEYSSFINNSVGVAIVESDDCKVVESTFEGNDIAISISYSDVSLSDNTFINNGVKVTRLKDEQPWEFTPLAATVCLVTLIPLVAFIALLLYFRFKRTPPSVQ